MSVRFDLSEAYANHYLHLLDEINREYILGGDAIEAAIAQFEEEWGQWRRSSKILPICSSYGNRSYTLIHSCPLEGMEL
jgi:hypothetical protein